MNRLLVVVGTDTGVGKTVVCAGLLHGLTARGLKVAGFKPIETGIPRTGDVSREPWPDWLRLEQASGQAPGSALGCSFALPAAPLAASLASGAPIDIETLEEKLSSLIKEHDVVIVEGAGGLLVPILDGMLWADYLPRLQPRCLVVGRLGLGSINHTLLTLEALRSRGIDPCGVVLCATEKPGPESEYTPALISKFGDVVVFDTIYWGVVEPYLVAKQLEEMGLLDLFDPRSTRPLSPTP
ncbi:MAG: dethiobiotin synthase [Polyangia bacterium]|jgi:dethiobiotin synthetase|nr:dethiobiotin synthase [Polyangia bacterium]